MFLLKKDAFRIYNSLLRYEKNNNLLPLKTVNHFIENRNMTKTTSNQFKYFYSYFNKLLYDKL